MFVILCSDLIAFGFSRFQRSFLSRTLPVFDESMDRFRHGLKRKAPASPQENVMCEDNKALPGKVIGKSPALVEVRPDIFHGRRSRVSPIRYLLLAEEF